MSKLNTAVSWGTWSVTHDFRPITRGVVFLGWIECACVEFLKRNDEVRTMFVDLVTEFSTGISARQGTVAIAWGEVNSAVVLSHVLMTWRVYLE